MVENLEYGTVVTASDLKGRTSLDPIWRVPDTSSDDLRCPGMKSSHARTTNDMLRSRSGATFSVQWTYFF
jgi:hypothetical protein